MPHVFVIYTVTAPVSLFLWHLRLFLHTPKWLPFHLFLMSLVVVQPVILHNFTFLLALFAPVIPNRSLSPKPSLSQSRLNVPLYDLYLIYVGRSLPIVSDRTVFSHPLTVMTRMITAQTALKRTRRQIQCKNIKVICTLTAVGPFEIRHARVQLYLSP